MAEVHRSMDSKRNRGSGLGIWRTSRDQRDTSSWIFSLWPDESFSRESISFITAASISALPGLNEKPDWLFETTRRWGERVSRGASHHPVPNPAR